MFAVNPVTVTKHSTFAVGQLIVDGNTALFSVQDTEVAPSGSSTLMENEVAVRNGLLAPLAGSVKLQPETPAGQVVDVIVAGGGWLVLYVTAVDAKDEMFAKFFAVTVIE